MSRLLVELPSDRGRCGRITLLGDEDERLCGPFPVAAKSSNGLAAAHHNQMRVPLLPYGDTPTGTYAVRGRTPTGPGTTLNKAEFGSCGAITLEPISGDAALADANGRFRFLVHAGDPSPDGQLRSTSGSLRMTNADLRALIRAVEQSACGCCTIVAVERAAGAPVFDDDSCASPDPISAMLDRQGLPQRTGGFHLPRRGTVLMVMGASFVAQNQANAASLRSTIAPEARSPGPRNIHWLPMTAAAVQPAQAYNPPPALSEQHAPPPATTSPSPTLQTIQNGGNTGVIFENSRGQAGSDVNVTGTTNVPAATGAPVSSGASQAPSAPQSPSVQAPPNSSPGDAAYQHYLEKQQQQQQEYNQRAQQVIQQINQQQAAPAAAAQPTAATPPPAPPPQKKKTEDYKVVKPGGSPERGR